MELKGGRENILDIAKNKTKQGLRLNITIEKKKLQLGEKDSKGYKIIKERINIYEKELKEREGK